MKTKKPNLKNRWNVIVSHGKYKFEELVYFEDNMWHWEKWKYIRKKKLVKETEIPSGHDPQKYIVERIKAKSHDGRMIPISLIRLKNSKQNGKSKS